MKIFTARSILTNTFIFKIIIEAQMCMSYQKMGHLDQTRTALRWDILQCTALHNCTNIHLHMYCVHLGQIRNADAKKDENLYCMPDTDKHNYI